MRLSINGSAYSEITVQEELETAIANLKPEFKDVIVLAKDINHFIKASGRIDENGEEHWNMEVRRGSRKEHYEAEFAVSRLVLQQTFISYLNEDDDWLFNITPWLPSDKSMNPWQLAVLVALILGVISFVTWEVLF